MRRVLVGLALLLAAGSAAAQEKQVITMPGGRPAGGPPLSPAVRVGDILFLSGQLGLPPQGQQSAGTAAEVKQALENIKRVLEVAGSSMDRVFKCTVFLADLADFAAMNEVYSSYFPKDPPARSTVQVAALVRGGKVEIECMALAGAGK